MLNLTDVYKTTYYTTSEHFIALVQCFRYADGRIVWAKANCFPNCTGAEKTAQENGAKPVTLEEFETILEEVQRWQRTRKY